jgi:SAM-dependent methyltransferase
MMGTAQLHNKLWGQRAREWSELQEHMMLPVYEVVFDHLGLKQGSRYLDVGCGTGLALQLAARRGAQVSGIDASAPSIEIARERVPAGNLSIGEMEELAFPDASFDVVSSFNAFQYAGSPLSALKEARRVLKPGGKVVMVTWGLPENCEHRVTLAAVSACLPPPPPGAGGPFALSEPGKLEGLMEQAELKPIESGEVDGPFIYPNEEIALKGICSAGPVVRVIQEVGEEKVYQVVRESLVSFKTPAGGYRQYNTFRYVIAKA